jgi:hypothetical protein
MRNMIITHRLPAHLTLSMYRCSRWYRNRVGNPLLYLGFTLIYFRTFLALDLGGTNMFVNVMYKQEPPAFNTFVSGVSVKLS